MEHWIEHHNIVREFQYGFRWARSSMDCVPPFVADVVQGFKRSECTLALAVDILALRVHRSLVRAYLEWGCRLFLLTRASLLKALDRQQYAALRVGFDV